MRRSPLAEKHPDQTDDTVWYSLGGTIDSIAVQVHSPSEKEIVRQVLKEVLDYNSTTGTRQPEDGIPNYAFDREKANWVEAVNGNLYMVRTPTKDVKLSFRDFCFNFQDVRFEGITGLSEDGMTPWQKYVNWSVPGSDVLPPNKLKENALSWGRSFYQLGVETKTQLVEHALSELMRSTALTPKELLDRIQKQLTVDLENLE
jgi:hypothetical protein